MPPIRALCAILLCVLSSCTTGAQLPDPARQPLLRVDASGASLWELRGVLHVHSRYSHDSEGRISEILDAAAATGCDFVIVTDHDRYGALPYAGAYSWQGRSILLLVGIEYSSRVGHLLDLFPRAFHHPKLPPQDLLDLIEQEGGFAVVAHPTDKRRPWQDWNLRGLRALEVYNTVSDMREDIKRLPGRVLSAIFGMGDSVLASVDRPTENIALWNELEKQLKPLVGVGACNAHGLRGGGTLNWDDYTNAFALISNRVWVRSIDAAGIEEAMRRGRLYIAFDALGDPAGFDFRFQRGDKEYLFGERVPAGDPGEIRVCLPVSAGIALYRDDRIVASGEGTELNYPNAGAGIWRVEAARRDSVYEEWRPWIISNPIRVDAQAMDSSRDE